MEKNGKKFENNFKKSVPENIFFYRFRDGSSSWGGNDKVRFQQTNICDCMMFDGYILYLLELKSTKGKSLPLKNIKQHQITDLLDKSKYLNVVCGFVIEFRELNECYFLEIKRFLEFLEQNDRKSIPIDFLRNKGIRIAVEKKKINNKFNIEKFVAQILEEVN